MQTDIAMLREAGVEDPRAEVEILLAAALGIGRAMLPTVDTIPRATLEQYRGWIHRRQLREPLAYILGRAEFYGRDYHVTPAVLIPRPSTETLVERALALAPQRVLEIGTGSGAIAITLALHGISVTATDISDAALQIAKKNSAAHRVSVDFQKADLFAPGTFDLIVSNPPYIPSGAIPTLAPELHYEPRLALDGGADGLDLIRKILTAAQGPILLEIGAGQSKIVSDFALHSGFQNVQFRKDLDGIDRVLEAS